MIKRSGVRSDQNPFISTFRVVKDLELIKLFIPFSNQRKPFKRPIFTGPDHLKL